MTITYDDWTKLPITEMGIYLITDIVGGTPDMVITAYSIKRYGYDRTVGIPPKSLRKQRNDKQT